MKHEHDYDDEIHMILEMIEQRRITAQEGLDIILALGNTDEPAPSEETPIQSASPDGIVDDQPPGNPSLEENVEPLQAPQNQVKAEGTANNQPELQQWRRWWLYPWWSGVILIVLSSLLLYGIQRSSGNSILLLCAMAPLLVSVALLVAAWQSRLGRWLHLRLTRPPGAWPRRIGFSFPLGGVAWFIRTFWGIIPGLQEHQADEMLQALEQNTNSEKPFFIDINESERGERVQIFIG